jgi:transcription antitermination factor NusG
MRGYDAYLPLHKTVKQYSDRLKTVEEVIMPSYVFVQVAEENMQQIRFIDGVVNFVYYLGKPAKLATEEIDVLKGVLSTGKNVKIEHIDLNQGDEIRLKTTAFFDQTAVVVRKNKRHIELLLKHFNLKLTIENTKLVYE